MKRKALQLLGIAALATGVYIVHSIELAYPSNDYLTNVTMSPKPGVALGGAAQTGAVTEQTLTSPTKAPAPTDPYQPVTLQTFTPGPTPTPVTYTLIKPDPSPCVAAPSAPNSGGFGPAPNYCP